MNTKLCDLVDSEVLARIHDAVRDERDATARVIGLLMEIDVRRLYLAEGCSSLFTYCTQVLHLSGIQPNRNCARSEAISGDPPSRGDRRDHTDDREAIGEMATLWRE